MSSYQMVCHWHSYTKLQKDLVSLLVLLGLRSMGSLKETASKYLLRRTKIDAGIQLPPLSMETLQVNPTCKNELEL